MKDVPLIAKLNELVIISASKEPAGPFVIQRPAICAGVKTHELLTNSIEQVEDDFDRAAAWGKTRGVPLYLGEFGVYNEAEMDSRALDASRPHHGGAAGGSTATQSPEPWCLRVWWKPLSPTICSWRWYGILLISSFRTRSPTTLIRLNYAHDLWYGVISDIAGQVSQHQPIDVSMPAFNAIWQGDALELKVVGDEQPTALLSDSRKMMEPLGKPRVSIDQLVDWIAHWTKIGGQTYGKPTHFKSRDGNF